MKLCLGMYTQLGFIGSNSVYSRNFDAFCFNWALGLFISTVHLAGIYVDDAVFYTLLICVCDVHQVWKNRREMRVMTVLNEVMKLNVQHLSSMLIQVPQARRGRGASVCVNNCVCVCVTEIKRPDPPVFTQPLQDCCVDEGSDIILQGSVTGSQPIKVSWLHNGEQKQFTLHMKMFLWF